MTAVPGPSSTPKQAVTTPKVVQFGFTKYHSLRRQEKPATTTVLAPLTINKDFRQQSTFEDDDDGPEP